MCEVELSGILLMIKQSEDKDCRAGASFRPAVEFIQAPFDRWYSAAL